MSLYLFIYIPSNHIHILAKYKTVPEHEIRNIDSRPEVNNKMRHSKFLLRALTRPRPWFSVSPVARLRLSSGTLSLSSSGGSGVSLCHTCGSRQPCVDRVPPLCTLLVSRSCAVAAGARGPDVGRSLAGRPDRSGAAPSGAQGSATGADGTTT